MNTALILKDMSILNESVTKQLLHQPTTNICSTQEDLWHTKMFIKWSLLEASPNYFQKRSFMGYLIYVKGATQIRYRQRETKSVFIVSCEVKVFLLAKVLLCITIAI